MNLVFCSDSSLARPGILQPLLPGHGQPCTQQIVCLRSRGPGHACSIRYAILPPRRLISCFTSPSLSRGVCLGLCNPLESAVLPKRHAVKNLALNLGLQLYWGLSWARLLFLTSRPSGVYLQAASQSSALICALRSRDVLEQLLDQVDVGHNHPTAAVTLAAELVHGVSVASHRVASVQSIHGN